MHIDDSRTPHLELAEALIREEQHADERDPATSQARAAADQLYRLVEHCFEKDWPVRRVKLAIAGALLRVRSSTLDDERDALRADRLASLRRTAAMLRDLAADADRAADGM